ncbi:hypothetical protein V8C37DRAFT_381824 [Trichoderma ceciliae]
MDGSREERSTLYLFFPYNFYFFFFFFLFLSWTLRSNISSASSNLLHFFLLFFKFTALLSRLYVGRGHITILVSRTLIQDMVMLLLLCLYNPGMIMGNIDTFTDGHERQRTKHCGLERGWLKADAAIHPWKLHVR